MMIKSAGIFSLAVFFICTGSVKNVNAQDKTEMKTLTERIDETANKLRLKLLLDEDQKMKIDSILTESLSKSISKENVPEIQKLLNRKIEALLTKRQKMKFEILESNWLDEILNIPK